MEYKTYKEIKEIVGVGWALIANPKWINNSVVLEGGYLLFFDEDKQKVIEESLKEKFRFVKRRTIHYCGERPDIAILPFVIVMDSELLKTMDELNALSTEEFENEE